MTAPRNPVPTAVHRARGPDGPWDGVQDDLRCHGVALVHASLAEWLPQRPDDNGLRRLLGRDWDRYRAQTGRRNAERFRVTRTLLKRVAAAAVGAEPGDLELGYALTGRLYVRGCDQVDLNLSHTGDMVLVGVTSLGLIGVDVESSDRALYGRGGEQRMCTPYELARLEALPEERRNMRLVRQWTLKEAYTKALGQGLCFPFDQFGFEVESDPPILQCADGSAAGNPAWSFRSLRAAERYVVGVALYDGGRGRTRDIALATTLDVDTVSTVRDVLRASHAAR